MARASKAYKDDVAPGGSPFRSALRRQVMFSGQPIALVVAEEWEIARYAASLVRVEYDKEPFATDLYCEAQLAVPIKAPANPAEAIFAPPRPRGRPEQANRGEPLGAGTPPNDYSRQSPPQNRTRP